MMITRGLRHLVLVAALMAAPFVAARAKDYPVKPIRIVAPFPAGSATDGLARALGQAITELTGQNVIVDNKPGANGIIAGESVVSAPPDGYTMLIGTHTTHAANSWLLKTVPYDAAKDFQPVTALARGWSFLIVNANSPVKSVQDLIEKAKQAPDTVTYGGGGATSRISVEQFAQMTGIKLVYVAYRGNPPAVQDLMGGQIDFMITDSTTALPQIRSGKLRALAFTAAERSPLAPDVPTMNQAGVKGYDSSYWQAAYLPAKTPEAIVEQLNALLHKASKRDVVKNYLKANGVVSFLSTPQELAKFQAEQSKIMGKIIRDAGIEAE